MDKHVAPAVAVLLLLVVAVQAHTQNPTSSSGDSSAVDALIRHTTFNVGDLLTAHPLPQTAKPKSSLSSREAKVTNVLTKPPRNIELRTPSTFSNLKSTTKSAAIATFPSSSLPDLISSSSDDASSSTAEMVLDDTTLSTDSSSSDERSTVGDTDSVASSHSNSERASSITITSQVVYVFSRVDDDANQSANDASSYSVGTVQPNNEGSANESAALAFSTAESTTLDQVDAMSSSPSTSTTPSFDKKTTSTIGSSKQDQDGNNTVLTSSDSVLSSPTFYACVVVGVVGFVGAVVASRAKGKRDVSDKWRVTTEASAVTPSLVVARPSAWAPPASEIHVIIDDHRFALL